MTFLNPLFLWALFTVLIPPAIHLFNFRRYKKVYFTNVRFLKEVQLESRSRSRLRELLILLFRCLAIASLVLAFSQPVITQSEEVPQPGTRTISIYIDNSFSMQNIGRNGPLIDQARQKAKEIIRAFGPQDKFQLLSNLFGGRQQRLLSREEALLAVDDVKISPAPRLLSQVVARQQEALNQESRGKKRIFIISDAQKSTFDVAQLKQSDSIPVSILPLPFNKTNNVYIDSCWFESPVLQYNKPSWLHARVWNTGEEVLESSSARLFLDGAQVAISSFSLKPNSSQNIKLEFRAGTKGFHYGSLKLEDFPVSFDDEYFFAYQSQKEVEVYVINGKGTEKSPVADLFLGDSLFHVVEGNETQINFALFRNCDLLVLNALNEFSSGMISEIRKFAEEGGALVIIPSLEEQPKGYKDLMTQLALPSFLELDTAITKVEKLELNSDFFAGVFQTKSETMNLPDVKQHFRLSENSAAFEPLIVLLNGDVLLGSQKTKGATLFLFSTSLNEHSGNFIKHALFVPVFYRMAFSAIRSQPLSYFVARNTMIGFKPTDLESEQPPKLISLKENLEIIPEFKRSGNLYRVFSRDQVTQPGYYVLKQNEQELMPLAFNYDRRESNLEAYSREELSELLEKNRLRDINLLDVTAVDFQGQVLQGIEPIGLWKLFLILALVFLATELFLLRFIK